MEKRYMIYMKERKCVNYFDRGLNGVSCQFVYRVKLVKFTNPVNHVWTIGGLHQVRIIVGVQRKYVGTLKENITCL